jgi:hypothetical protein
VKQQDLLFSLTWIAATELDSSCRTGLRIILAYRRENLVQDVEQLF